MVLLAMAGVCAVATIEPVAVYLEFDRTHILAGQWWRLITGNFAHYGWRHLLPNLFYLLLLSALLQREVVPGWKGYLCLGSMATTIALLLEPSGLDQYRGVSALLYGFTVWCALAVGCEGRKYLFLVPVLILGFILLEVRGVLSFRSLGQVSVYPLAHLYAVCAALVWFPIRFYRLWFGQNERTG